MNAEIIAIVNQKGGVGKSFSCINIGVGLARAGKKVLLVDFDPQASMTIALGYAHATNYLIWIFFFRLSSQLCADLPRIIAHSYTMIPNCNIM